MSRLDPLYTLGLLLAALPESKMEEGGLIPGMDESCLALFDMITACLLSPRSRTILHHPVGAAPHHPTVHRFCCCAVRYPPSSNTARPNDQVMHFKHGRGTTETGFRSARTSHSIFLASFPPPPMSAGICVTQQNAYPAGRNDHLDKSGLLCIMRGSL